MHDAASGPVDGFRTAFPIINGESIRTLPEAARLFFSFPGPRLLAGTAGAAFLARALLGPPGPSDAVICASVATYWPFQEWAAHRYFLHIQPTDRHDPWFAAVHRAHHRNPGDIELALLPPPLLRRAIPVNIGLWLALGRVKRSALTGIAATSAMSLFYEWCHFLVHTGYKPKSRWFRRIRRNHRLHHYHNENHWFGFTVTAIDTLLGTAPDHRGVPHSPTARDLHGLARADGG